MDTEEFPGCCGAYVITEFEELEGCYDKEERQAVIQGFYDSVSSASNGKLLVAVLIDSQLRQGWLSVLQKAGFKRVSRWTNNNHGNVCNMFVKYKGDAVSPKYKGRERVKSKPVAAQMPEYKDFINSPW